MIKGDVFMKKIKEHISNEVVYKITLILVSVIATFFFIKNVISKQTGAMIVIGVTLAIFAIVQIVVNFLKNKRL